MKKSQYLTLLRSAWTGIPFEDAVRGISLPIMTKMVAVELFCKKDMDSEVANAVREQCLNLANPGHFIFDAE